MNDTAPWIPFNRAIIGARERENLAGVIDSGRICGDQTFTRACQAMLERQLGVARALLTTSCTHALEMAALLLRLRPGDEVIVPDFTFVSTVNAFVLHGARPVFCDVRPDTLNLDERRLESLVTARTRAVVPVHYAGVGCEMDAILAIAGRHGIAVIEDNAHGLFARYRGRWLGTLGALATQSFHETKNVTCGEGGALLLNDPGFVERAEILREKGTNRARFFRGQVDKYTWVDVGSSWVMSDILAAVLEAQLSGWVEIQERRRAVWTRYHEGLSDWAKAQGVRQPHVPEHCDQAWHMYYLLLPTLAHRTRLIAHLKEHRIQAVFHYLPLHRSDCGLVHGGASADCPVTEDVSDRLLRLPFFAGLEVADQDRVIEAIRGFRC